MSGVQPEGAHFPEFSAMRDRLFRSGVIEDIREDLWVLINLLSSAFEGEQPDNLVALIPLGVPRLLVLRKVLRLECKELAHRTSLRACL